jgi:hypothetical protein
MQAMVKTLGLAMVLGLSACASEQTGQEPAELDGAMTEMVRGWAETYCVKRWSTCSPWLGDEKNANVVSCTSTSMYSVGCDVTDDGKYNCASLVPVGYEACMAEIDALACETLIGPGQESKWALPPCFPFE